MLVSLLLVVFGLYCFDWPLKGACVRVYVCVCVYAVASSNIYALNCYNGIVIQSVLFVGGKHVNTEMRRYAAVH